jgi:hypothetical protein
MRERQAAFVFEAKKDRLTERKYAAVPQFWRLVAHVVRMTPFRADCFALTPQEIAHGFGNSP